MKKEPINVKTVDDSSATMTSTKTSLSTASYSQSSTFIKELKNLVEPYVIDPNLFTNTFSKELKNLAYDMSLDDIERYAESRESNKQ